MSSVGFKTSKIAFLLSDCLTINKTRTILRLAEKSKFYRSRSFELSVRSRNARQCLSVAKCQVKCQMLAAKRSKLFFIPKTITVDQDGDKILTKICRL